MKRSAEVKSTDDRLDPLRVALTGLLTSTAAALPEHRSWPEVALAASGLACTFFILRVELRRWKAFRALDRTHLG